MAIGAVTIGILLVFAYETLRLKGAARRSIVVVLIMMFEAVVFFVLYSQMPTSLNFFAIHNVETSLLGLNFEPGQFQPLNLFWIMFASPLLAADYNRLGDRLPMPFKFAIGMELCSLAFLVVPQGSSFASDASIVSLYWLILSCALQSIGELMISGPGLAKMVRLLHQRLMGFIMGVWFLTTSASVIIAGFVANLSAVRSIVCDPQHFLKVYSHVFLQIGICTGVIVVLMLAFAPKFNRLSRADTATQSVQNSMTHVTQGE